MAIFYFIVTFNSSYFILFVSYQCDSPQTKQVWLIFPFSELLQTFTRVPFPYIFPQSLSWAAFFASVSMFWCLSPPCFCWWAIFYFLSPWFALSFHSSSQHTILTMIYSGSLLSLYFYLYCNCIECFSLWQFLSHLSWSFWWTTQCSTTS